MLVFAISAVAIAFYIHFVRRSERYAVVGGKARAFKPAPLGRWNLVALAFVSLWALLAFVLPLLTLAWVAVIPYMQPPSLAALAAVRFTSFGFALSYIGGPLLNTLMVAAGAAFLRWCGAQASRGW